MSKHSVSKSCCTNIKKSSCEDNKSNLCPVCKLPGAHVKNVTVRHLVLDELTEQIGDEDYYLCMSEKCDITYYNPVTQITMNKRQIKVPLWFKEDANPKYACYCSKVTEEQVINAVIKDGATDINDVIKITGAMKNSHCEKNNPLGKCCHQMLQKAIDKGLSMK
jgi:bacterioferritin-associated ferredoxin